MTNADKFKSLFGIYATELWAMSEKEFLEWLNSEVDNCSEIPNNWIPVSKRLPEEAGAYICTCIDAGRLMVTQIKWQPKLKSWNLSGARSYWKVIAWQEIKPYQPKEE